MGITNELSVLGVAGDIKVTWDNGNAASRAKARAEVATLKAAGYLFFLVDGTQADEVAAGGGELLARIVTADEIVADEPESETEATTADEPVAEPVEGPKRRGRPKGALNQPKVKTIAVPPLRGG